MSKIQQFSTQAKFVIIPKVLCDLMNWDKGDELSWNQLSKNVITLTKNNVGRDDQVKDK